MDRFELENAILAFMTISEDFDWAINNGADPDALATLNQYMKFKYDQLWDTFIKEFKLDKYNDGSNRR